ncbi:MAG TPA: hypothetical protein VHW23_28590 [Kofleriaceae bacterium]|nr:hypothetical protein [Kofleriaceae bacterium]
MEQLQATMPVQPERAAGTQPAPRPATQISFAGAPSAGGLDLGGLGAVGENTDLAGAATKSGTTDTEAAMWKDHGAFRWAVAWTTDGTSGWIVQKITSTYTGTRKDGSAITLASVGTTPSYYEAWAVDNSGKVSPAVGATNDIWARGSKGDGSKGTWSIKGDVHWTSSDPAKSGLTPGGVANAGILLSGTSAPAGLSGVLQTRHADGAWDSTKTPATHTGSAG